MRTISFIIFYSIVFTIYFSVNYYIFSRGWQSIPSESRARIFYLVAFIILAASFIIGRTMEKYMPGLLSNALVWTGSFWLAAMMYFFLIVVFIDIIRLADYVIPFLGKIIPQDNMATFKFTAFKTIVLIVSLLIFFGHLNTLFPKITKLDISIPSRSSEMKELNLVLVSDIHLGTLTPKKHIQKRINLINSLRPDIILLAGDILDEDLTPVIRLDLGNALKELRAPMGVYGITGNHEYIGGVEPAVNYLENHGITILRDSVIKINNSFYLAGREDRDINRFSGDTRLPVEELIKDTPRDLPIILMDHQPYELGKSAAAGASLQVSGHTHHGQIWPLNYITRAVYEISRGYGNVNGMHVYVSNGLGTWGPPVRIGTRPEIVSMKVRFIKE
jgi:uncharacterized protein